MNDLYDKIEEAISYIRGRTGLKPDIGLIFGTGLGGLADRIESPVIIPYEEIPNFPRPTVMSHRGNLVLGAIGGRTVAAMQGRFHLYEGYSGVEVTLPIRVMKRLGISVLIIASAAGGLSPSFRIGDIMLVVDHINLMGENPLRGIIDERLGQRFPSMVTPYDRELIRLAEKIAREETINFVKGTYVGVMGPSLETQSETRFIRQIGADAVGMSTVPEVIVGIHCNLRILAMVIISNVNMPGDMPKHTLEEIVENASRAAPYLERLIERVVREINPI
ncbi:MAG: purine-nucleoside phosphorylase [Deltaproteobacteria bacterium]|nr:purine-nucleoside phosphorylase [Deltaproteobacteria bacterium]MBW2148372.1 purine-nucleoside phosphorylase [Deltaproteobacteria bacterium]MBW2307390.1 purine-nucleoside phosphorylase [Deltaproteobacteria bacterium]